MERAGEKRMGRVQRGSSSITQLIHIHSINQNLTKMRPKTVHLSYQKAIGELSSLPIPIPTPYYFYPHIHIHVYKIVSSHRERGYI